MAVQADIGNFEQSQAMIEKVIERYGRIDVLVNNAGVWRGGKINLVTKADWDYVIDTNVKGLFNCTQSVVPQMIKQGGGSIINITSIIGLIGFAGDSIYGSTKAAIIGFTKSLSKEVARRGITVNAMLPLDAAAQADLAHEYERLALFPDARAALVALAPRPRWVLSNGTHAMLDPLLTASGLDDVLDGCISVDEAGVYKPSPAVYALAANRLDLPPASIAFVSANAWDAAGAQAFGFTAFWINRAGVPFERHAPPPAYAVGSLREVAAIVAA
jgi:2-haloalkanoic acid dehalogenase type II